MRSLNSFGIAQHTDSRGAHSIGVTYCLARFSNVMDYAVRSYREDDCLPPLPTKLMPPTTRRPRRPCAQNVRGFACQPSVPSVCSLEKRADFWLDSRRRRRSHHFCRYRPVLFLRHVRKRSRTDQRGMVSHRESRHCGGREAGPGSSAFFPSFPSLRLSAPIFGTETVHCTGGRTLDRVGEKGRYEEGGGKGTGSDAAAERVPFLPSPTSASKTLTLPPSQYRNPSDCSRMAPSPVRVDFSLLVPLFPATFFPSPP
jgi:hypothetical protein